MPTTDWTRNISWFQFYKYNLSYLHIAEFGYMELNYRQNHYAFWREYFPTVSAWDYFPTVSAWDYFSTVSTRPPSKPPFPTLSTT